MGIIIRQSVIGSLVAYVGVIIGTINVLFLYPRILSPEQFGLTKLLLEVSILIAQFAQLGVTNTCIKFFPQFKDLENKHNGFLFLILIIPMIGIILAGLALPIFRDQFILFYQEKSPLFVQYYYFIIPFFVFIVYNRILTSYLTSLHRIVVPKIIDQVFLRLVTLTLLTLVHFEIIEFHLFILIFIAMYLVSILLLLIYIASLNQLFIKPSFKMIDKPVLKEMSTYGLFVLIGVTGALFVSKIDILMLGYMAGLKSIAIYTIAFYIGSIIDIPKRPLSQISSALISSAWKENNLNEIRKIYKKSSINQLIVGGILFSVIWSSTDVLLSLLPEAYENGKYVILFIGLAKLIDMAAGVNGEIIFTSKYYKVNVFFILILIIMTIGMNFILIPKFGIVGAALGTTISLLVYNSVKLIFIWVILKTHPFSTNTLKFVIILACAFALNYAAPIGNPVITIALSIGIGILITVLTFYLNLSSDFSNVIRKVTGRVSKLLYK